MKHVLYVEDNPADAELAAMALQEIGADIELHVVGNGPQAFEFLTRNGGKPGLPLAAPDLILLDLNLPVFTGAMVLAELRRHPTWSSIPVVMYTSSSLERDRALATRLGARFENKPSNWDDALALAGRLIACVESRPCPDRRRPELVL